MSLITRVLALRRDGRLLKVPPYLSALLIVIGVAWLFLLPLREYSRKTYVSENALLPGQVHTYFQGSEHNIFRAYRHEVYAIAQKPKEERSEGIKEIFASAGLKVATQKYKYEAAGTVKSGQNVYAVLQGPRADATEAIVMVASWTTMAGEINTSGVALVLTLARYMKRWSLWSKDVIFLISGDSTEGPQAWVDAYHNAATSGEVEPLPIKSGALQGAVAIEYPAGPWGRRFDKLHFLYDGINGQLPNLDLFNTAVQISSGQMATNCAIQDMLKHDDSYEHRLQTMLRGMLKQGMGHATGPHSSFVPYHVDAVTIQTVGDGWHDEITLGRTIEGLFRSLNNLLEHLHQSFFFYLLLETKVFVSIGTYLPSAMLVAANFTITCIALWVQSGRPTQKPKGVGKTSDAKTPSKEKIVAVKEGNAVALVPESTFSVVERKTFLPLGFIAGVHFLGLLPLYLFNNSSESILGPLFYTSLAASFILPPLLAAALSATHSPSEQEVTLIQCFSLLLIGMFLSALATLNFSLSFIIGVLASPLSFVRCFKSNIPVAAVLLAALYAVNPLFVTFAATKYFEYDIVSLLARASLGWHAWGLYTQVIVWLVWWPAWLAGAVTVSLSFL